MSVSDVGVLRTAPAVFSTITGIAIMHTTNTLEVRPMPYIMTSSGMSAASGAACITIKTGENSQSNQRLNPIHSPSAMPVNADISTPIASGFRVSA